MMLNEPVLAVLPATEEEIIAAFPRVSKDYILKKIRSLEVTPGRGGYIRKRRNGVFYRVEPKKDEPDKKRDQTYKMHERTCEICNRTFKGINKHFGSRKNPVCTECRIKHGRTKVCKICNARKPIIEFRRRLSRGKFSHAPMCEACRIV